MSDDLVTFLRARVDEDEQIAVATLNAAERVAQRKGKPIPRWEFGRDQG